MDEAAQQWLKERFAAEYRWQMHLSTNEFLYGSPYSPWVHQPRSKASPQSRNPPDVRVAKITSYSSWSWPDDELWVWPDNDDD